MKQILLALLFACAVMAQTKSGTTGKSTSKANHKATSKAPARNLLNPSTLNRVAPAVFRAKLTTTKGDIVIQVTRAWAPHGADRFYNLVRGGFFTDASFFRVIAGFMAQFGISARPDVSRAWASANIPDDPVKESNTRGRVTFAQTSAPNSRSTQIFINFGNNSQLDGQRFAPFGEVVEGMNVVDMLYSGYGEASDQQDRIEAEGKTFLDRNYPKVDRILRASIVPATPAAPAASKAPAAAPKAAPAKKQ